MNVAICEETFRVSEEPRFFWDWVASGTWEPYTFETIRQHIDAGHWMLDVGAWIGPTALYAARIGGGVYALEPDPVAFELMTENLRLNPADAAKIATERIAVAGEVGAIKLADSELGRSMTSVFKDGDGFEVEATTLDRAYREGERHMPPGMPCGLIKMDIEGAEAFVVPRAAEWLLDMGIPVSLSLHFHLIPQEYHGSLLAALSRFRVHDRDDRREVPIDLDADEDVVILHKP